MLEMPAGRSCMPIQCYVYCLTASCVVGLPTLGSWNHVCDSRRHKNMHAVKQFVCHCASLRNLIACCRKQCKLNNIRLIEIDVLFDYTPIEKLKETIKEKLILLEIDIPKNFDKINPKLKELNIYHKKNK